MSKWEDNTEHNREMMVDSIMSRRDEPTRYQAPAKDQKWRARELFGFMWRHLGIGIAPGYRDVMLFLIDKGQRRQWAKRPRPTVPPFDVARAAEVRPRRPPSSNDQSLITIGDESWATPFGLAVLASSHN